MNNWNHVQQVCGDLATLSNYHDVNHVKTLSKSQVKLIFPTHTEGLFLHKNITPPPSFLKKRFINRDYEGYLSFSVHVYLFETFSFQFCSNMYQRNQGYELYTNPHSISDGQNKFIYKQVVVYASQTSTVCPVLYCTKTCTTSQTSWSLFRAKNPNYMAMQCGVLDYYAPYVLYWTIRRHVLPSKLGQACSGIKP